MWRQILFRYSSAEFLGRKAYRLILSHRDEGVRLMLERIESARAPMKFSRSNFMCVRQPLNFAYYFNKSVKLSFKSIYLPQMGIYLQNRRGVNLLNATRLPMKFCLITSLLKHSKPRCVRRFAHLTARQNAQSGLLEILHFCLKAPLARRAYPRMFEAPSHT